MTYFTKSFITFLTVLLISCGDSKKESEKIPEKSSYEIRHDKQKLLDSLNKNEASKLTNNYNAIVGWDTVNHFTFYLQELFEKEKRPISFIGIIIDVIKKDTSYVLKVISSNMTFNAEISVTKELFNKLNPLLQEKEIIEGCFIFKVTNITSNNSILESEIDPNGDNALLKFHGKLIDFCLYDRLK